jgi:CheY-like chemotaxis protein
VRRVLVRQLEQLGYRVLDVSTGAQALEALGATDDIALMITDVRLGAGLDGHGLASRAREQRPELRIVFISGGGDDPEPGTPPGSPVLAKPFTQSELVAVLARALG